MKEEHAGNERVIAHSWEAGRAQEQEKLGLRPIPTVATPALASVQCSFLPTTEALSLLTSLLFQLWDALESQVLLDDVGVLANDRQLTGPLWKHQSVLTQI